MCVEIFYMYNAGLQERYMLDCTMSLGIETLPQELQRNFTVMRTLDQKTEDVTTEIDRCSQNYRDEVSHLSDKEKSRELNNIQEMFKKAIENSDNKVQMAMQMYEMVSCCLFKFVNSLSTDNYYTREKLSSRLYGGIEP